MLAIRKSTDPTWSGCQTPACDSVGRPSDSARARIVMTLNASVPSSCTTALTQSGFLRLNSRVDRGGPAGVCATAVRHWTTAAAVKNSAPTAKTALTVISETSSHTSTVPAANRNEPRPNPHDIAWSRWRSVIGVEFQTVFSSPREGVDAQGRCHGDPTKMSRTLSLVGQDVGLARTCALAWAIASSREG